MTDGHDNTTRSFFLQDNEITEKFYFGLVTSIESSSGNLKIPIGTSIYVLTKSPELEFSSDAVHLLVVCRDFKNWSDPSLLFIQKLFTYSFKNLKRIMLSMAFVDRTIIRLINRFKLNIFHVNVIVCESTPLEMATRALQLEDLETEALQLSFNFPMTIQYPTKLNALKFYVSEQCCKPFAMNSMFKYNYLAYDFKIDSIILNDLEIIAHPKSEKPIAFWLPETPNLKVVNLEIPSDKGTMIVRDPVLLYNNFMGEICLGYNNISLGYFRPPHFFTEILDPSKFSESCNVTIDRRQTH